MKNIFLTFFLFLTIGLCAYTDHSGNISSNETWTAQTGPHRINGDITVDDGATLTINPGATVYFYGNYSLNINGTLIADGTGGQITFDYYNQTFHDPGEWNKIRFSSVDNDCLMLNCDIKYGGSVDAMIVINNCQDRVTIQNSTLSYSASIGIKVTDDSSDPDLYDLSFGSIAGNLIESHVKPLADYFVNGYSNCPNPYIAVRGGNIDTGALRRQYAKILVNGDIAIANGATTTVDEGNEFVFNGDYKLRIDGQLHTNGTAANPVIFTSSSQTEGSWEGLDFNVVDGNCLMNYCEIRYAGSSGKAVEITSSDDDITFDHCLINSSGSRGIDFDSYSSPTITNTVFSNNTSYSIAGNAPVVIENINSNTFTGNTLDAVLLDSGEFSTSTIYRNSDLEYHVGSMISVADNETLTIEPGVAMKFNSQAGMTVYGSIFALGQSGNEISFTSASVNPSAGNWTSIYLYNIDADCFFDYCNFSYGGQDVYSNPNHEKCLLSMYSSSSNASYAYVTNTDFSNSGAMGIKAKSYSKIVVDNCSFSNINSYGVYSDNAYGYYVISNTSFDTIGDYPLQVYFKNAVRMFELSFSNLTNNFINLKGSDVSSGTLSNFGIPYKVEGAVTVSDGEVLSVEPGVTYLGNNMLNVEGLLMADASPEEPILFSSISGSPDGWYGIDFSNCDVGSIIDNCTIENGGLNAYGTYFDEQAVLYFNNSGQTIITNTTIGPSSRYGIKMSSTTDFTLNNVEITGCQQSCLLTSSYTPTFSLDNVTFSNNASYIGELYPRQLYMLNNISILNNTDNTFRVNAGTAGTGTIHDFGIEYFLAGTTTISDGHTMTIEPGVHFSADNTSMIIQGALNAVGTVNDSIVFRSKDNYAGQWYGLIFDNPDSGTELQYVDLSGGGRNTYGTYWDEESNIAIRGGTGVPVISNCTFRNSAADGIRLTSGATAQISNTLIENGGNRGIYTMSNSCGATFDDCEITGFTGSPVYTFSNLIGKYSNMNIHDNTADYFEVAPNNMGSATWKNNGVPYKMNGGFTLFDGNTLTIDPGVEIQFGGTSTLKIEGKLFANGTQAEPILFTTSNETPMVGHWGCLYFYNADDTSRVNHTILEYGGVNLTYTPFEEYSQLAVYRSTVEVNNSEIRNSFYGVKTGRDADLRMINCKIHDNTHNGIYITSNSHVSFGDQLSEWNEIYNNEDYNIYNESSNSQIARYIYWGNDTISVVDDGIYDYYENSSYGKVSILPYTDQSHSLLLGTPAAPQNIEIAYNTGDIEVTWDAVSGSSYRVYSSTDSELPEDQWTLEADNIYGTSWTDSSPGVKKFYIVKSVRD